MSVFDNFRSFFLSINLLKLAGPFCVEIRLTSAFSQLLKFYLEWQMYIASEQFIARPDILADLRNK